MKIIKTFLKTVTILFLPTPVLASPTWVVPTWNSGDCKVWIKSRSTWILISPRACHKEESPKTVRPTPTEAAQRRAQEQIESKSRARDQFTAFRASADVD